MNRMRPGVMTVWSGTLFGGAQWNVGFGTSIWRSDSVDLWDDAVVLWPAVAVLVEVVAGISKLADDDWDFDGTFQSVDDEAWTVVDDGNGELVDVGISGL